MNLAQWHFKAFRLNQTDVRRCPRPIPCSDRDDVALYEYVTSKEGRAIVLHCLACGALQHLETWVGNTPIMPATEEDEAPRTVHLPIGPRARRQRVLEGEIQTRSYKYKGGHR